jgi:hypothetical protein
MGADHPNLPFRTPAVNQRTRAYLPDG